MTDEAVAKASDPVGKAPVVSRMELVKRVQAATGAKQKDVQTIVRATLEAMGGALRSGERLHVPPFGSTRIVNKSGEAKEGVLRIILRDIKEKEKPARAERPATARSGRPAPADKAARRAGKQALAAKGEAD